jgi:hypothetical protein
MRFAEPDILSDPLLRTYTVESDPNTTSRDPLAAVAQALNLARARRVDA